MASEQGTTVELRRARRKLAETKFFLGHLEQQTHKFQQNPGAYVDGTEIPPFDFYLSAFLSAGRSVTLVLQDEDKDRYDRVFPGWSDALPEEDRRLLAFMNKQRVAEVHTEEGAKVDHHGGLIPITEVWHEPGGSRYFIAQFGGPYSPFGGDDYAPVREVAVLAPQFEVDGESRDAMEVCRRYAGLLEEVVRACEQAAPTPPGPARADAGRGSESTPNL
jgi:hypothetical protein